MEAFLTELAKQGPIGLMAGLFVYLYLSERKENRELQSKRMDDWKEANRSYDELADKAMIAMREQKSAFDALRAVVEAQMRNHA